MQRKVLTVIQPKESSSRAERQVLGDNPLNKGRIKELALSLHKDNRHKNDQLM